MEPVICRDLELLHPAIRGGCINLLAAAAAAYEAGTIPAPLEVFETYRTPARQRALRRAGTSKADAWSSAHQFGLACDFVPRPNGKWSWDGPGCAESFRWLRANAPRFGLVSNISWDWPHVEHPRFVHVRNALALPVLKAS